MTDFFWIVKIKAQVNRAADKARQKHLNDVCSNKAKKPVRLKFLEKKDSNNVAQRPVRSFHSGARRRNVSEEVPVLVKIRPELNSEN